MTIDRRPKWNRRSLSGHGFPMILQMNRHFPIAFAIFLYVLGSLQGQAIEVPDIDPGETIVIRADAARETRGDRDNTAASQTTGSQPDERALHFDGNFSLEAPDWFVTSDTAVLYGDVDDPIRLEVEGAPARVWTLDEQGNLEVDATAKVIKYFRHNDRLVLSGDAELVEQGNRLRSSSIDYDLAERRLVATGKGGVQIIAQPNRDPKN